MTFSSDTNLLTLKPNLNGTLKTDMRPIVYTRELLRDHGISSYLVIAWYMRSEYRQLGQQLHNSIQSVHTPNDRRAAIVKIADYLGYDLNDDKINKITDHCSFKNMKKASLMEPSVRKGIVGDWKNVFTVAENEAFERIYNEKMKGTGLSFEW
uniref:Sulfotransferase 1C2A-like n=1 Tax=Saccoglossus kowalevskii TaxID=10224 RepID=A0ABM0MIC3_SACKO|nr:PREDICTED: sulfotransferase 1C2A-like [Saccoglossus kowalevskii]